MGSSSQFLDIVWLIICSGLVVLMQAGFCCLESGLVRSKNSINVAIKNLAGFCVSSLMFWSIGYALMFGGSILGWIGSSGFFFGEEENPFQMAFFLFQMLFCCTATTLISGAVAERMRFSGYLVIAGLMSVIIYPIQGHWAWAKGENGELTGWLGQIGFVDFAGSTVVHSTGGWAALAAILVLGPRIGRFKKGEPPLNGHNLPMATLGVFLLWLGWFGFNGGSLLTVSESIPMIVVNLSLAGAAGGTVSMFVSWKVLHYPDAKHVINGCLTGLVAITASCNIVTPFSAALIGGVAGILAVLITVLLERWKIDDAIGVLPVHGGGGTWGTLAVALLGDPGKWGTNLERSEQFLIQMLGILVDFFWAFGVVYLVLWIVNKRYPFRVSAENERKGLNITEHQANSEVLDLLREMENQRENGDFSKPVMVEPHTETGLIAVEYNQVAKKFNQEKKKLIEANQKILSVNEEMKEAKDEALEASRIKSTFLANMSHELRTPLNAVIGYSEMLQEDAEEIGQLDFVSDLQRIHQAGNHLLALINNVLDLSKIEAGKMDLYPESIQVASLVEEVKNVITPLAEKNNNQFQTQIVGEHGLIRSDLTKLRQVLFNLLSNACKFTKNGAIILIVQQETIGSQDWLTFEVGDSGIGLTSEQIENLFRPFTQADASTTRNFGGTGLGLAISRKFSEILGGELKVESEIDEGTTFFFRIPRIVPDSKPSENQKISSNRLPRESPLVLVIDDDQAVRNLMSRILAKEGFEVKTAENGTQGFELAKKIHPAAITLDVVLPDLEGWSILSKIKSDPELATIPVIMVSMTDSQEKGFTLGASDYLTKPVERTRLLPMVKKYVNGQNANVLVVEDEPDIRRLLGTTLRKEGYVVEEAPNGKVALERIAVNTPQMIILDIMMPEVNGFQVIEKLKENEKWREIPVVLLTAMDLSEEDRSNLANQVQGFLSKSIYSRDQLLATVQQAILSKIPLP